MILLETCYQKILRVDFPLFKLMCRCKVPSSTMWSKAFIFLKRLLFFGERRLFFGHIWVSMGIYSYPVCIYVYIYIYIYVSFCHSLHFSHLSVVDVATLTSSIMGNLAKCFYFFEKGFYFLEEDVYFRRFTCVGVVRCR